MKREVKDLPDQMAIETKAEIDRQAREPSRSRRLPLNYERRYFMHAAIASTRNAMRRSPISPMPNIMPIGMLDMSIIMNCLPSCAQSDGTVTHRRFAYLINTDEVFGTHRRPSTKSRRASAWCNVARLVDYLAYIAAQLQLDVAALL